MKRSPLIWLFCILGSFHNITYRVDRRRNIKDYMYIDIMECKYLSYKFVDVDSGENTC